MAIKKRGGFSLLEVLIASIIMVIGVIGLFPAFNSGLKNNSRARAWTEVADIAQDEIEKIKSGLLTSYSGQRGRYSWKIEKTFNVDLPDVPVDSLEKYVLTVSWMDKGRKRNERFVYIKQVDGE